MGDMLGSLWTQALEQGVDATVRAGPVALLAVIATETTGLAAAQIEVRSVDGVLHLLLAAPAGGTVSVTLHAALPNGLRVGVTAGAATIAVSYV